jgi:site-specific recombinase XerD
LRRSSLSKLRIGEHLARSGEAWFVDVPARETKTRRRLNYALAPTLSASVDLFLDRFRHRITGAERHSGLWPSRRGAPLGSYAIYLIVTRHTLAALGFSVSPHRFRHGAATFLAERDPANVRMAMDLLSHASFSTTDKYYLMAQSRLAGRALARAIAQRRPDRDDGVV